MRGSDAAGGSKVVSVWPDLLPAAGVFQRCIMQVGGMSGAPMGLPATEIRAALEMMDVPREDWPLVSADVTAMGRIAAKGINSKAK